jgi:hypothetical protein
MINEHDIADWIHLDPVPLYSVPNKSYIKLGDTTLFFDHIDGMFSYCVDLNNKVFHIAANATVVPLVKPEKL